MILILKKFPNDIISKIFSFFEKKKCDYCNKNNFIFNMKNILYLSEYFFNCKEKKYSYKCIEC